MLNYDCVSFSSSIVNVPYVIILSVSICISSLLVWISINTFKTYCLDLVVLSWHRDIALTVLHCLDLVILPWPCGIAVTLWYCPDLVALPWPCGIGVTLWYCPDLVALPWPCGIALTLWHCRDLVILPLPCIWPYLVLFFALQRIRKPKVQQVDEGNDAYTSDPKYATWLPPTGMQQDIFLVSLNAGNGLLI